MRDMETPTWIKEVLAHFDDKTEPHSEVEIAEGLEAARAKQGVLAGEDAKVYLAEHSVFLLRGVPRPFDGCSLCGRRLGLDEDHFCP